MGSPPPYIRYYYSALEISLIGSAPRFNGLVRMYIFWYVLVCTSLGLIATILPWEKGHSVLSTLFNFSNCSIASLWRNLARRETTTTFLTENQSFCLEKQSYFSKFSLSLLLRAFSLKRRLFRKKEGSGRLQ